MPADRLHLLPSRVFYNESVTRAASKGKYVTTGSKGMHTKPRNLYRPIKVKQKVRSISSVTTATHGGLPYTALVYGGPLYAALMHGPHARHSYARQSTRQFCTAK